MLHVLEVQFGTARVDALLVLTMLVCVDVACIAGALCVDAAFVAVACIASALCVHGACVAMLPVPIHCLCCYSVCVATLLVLTFCVLILCLCCYSACIDSLCVDTLFVDVAWLLLLVPSGLWLCC